MKISNYSISIQNPCQENWEAMSEAEKGRHCKKCQTNVIDFSSMSDTEIIAMIEKKKGQSMCGRFKANQLHRPLVLHYPPFAVPRFNLLLAGLLIFSSVNTSMAHSVDADKSTKAEQQMLKGDVNIVPHSIPINPDKPAPTIFKVKVLDEESKLPLRQVRIQIANSNQIYYANEMGACSFIIPDSILTDTMQFIISNPGFTSLTVQVPKSELQQERTITLSEDVQKFLGMMIIEDRRIINRTK